MNKSNQHIVKIITGCALVFLFCTSFLSCQKKKHTQEIVKEEPHEEEPEPEPNAPPDFTIAVIGDTQNYVDYGNDPDDADCQAMSPFTDMINWVKDNKTTENIQYVVSLGDITDQFGQTNVGTEGQWQRARNT